MSTKKPDTPKSQMAGTDTLDRDNSNSKLKSLETFRSDATGQALRTNQGVKIADNQNTLKAGARGPSLLEDFIMREKITHFDHERIPSASCMPEGWVPMVTSRAMTTIRH
ncbi:hypothetical protein PBOI14_00970 [Pseudomonas sp. Boi14]|nr:hypothetical protein PBOI14_00970 [Pseudomonas sp. Boi14]